MTFRQYRPFERGEFIVVGVDTAAGGNDYSCAAFLSKKHLDVPLVFQQNVTASFMTDSLHPVLEKIYDVTGTAPIIAYERQNGGVFEIERLSGLNRLQKYRIYTMQTFGNIINADESKLGWDTNTATRPKMLADLKDAVDHHLLHIHDKPTINEMYSFIINKQGKPVAEVGAHDDLVMSLAIAWQLYQTQNPRSSVPLKQYNPKRWAIA